MNNRLLNFPVLAMLTMAGLVSPQSAAAQKVDVKAQEDVDRLVQELSNRGRWGAEDQRGTLNLLTSEKRIEAAALAVDGGTGSPLNPIATF